MGKYLFLLMVAGVFSLSISYWTTTYNNTVCFTVYPKLENCFDFRGDELRYIPDDT